MEQLELASTPPDETCASVGYAYYEQLAKLECEAYKALLIRALGEPPAGCRLKRISCPHDFGNYYILAVVFHGRDDKASDYAYKCEGEGPAEWDEPAIDWLTERDYFKLLEMNKRNKD